jgi:hypothetical protein
MVKEKILWRKRHHKEFEDKKLEIFGIFEVEFSLAVLFFSASLQESYSGTICCLFVGHVNKKKRLKGYDFAIGARLCYRDTILIPQGRDLKYMDTIYYGFTCQGSNFEDKYAIWMYLKATKITFYYK